MSPDPSLVRRCRGKLSAGGALRTSAAQSGMLRELGERPLDHVLRWIERAGDPIASLGRRGVVGGGDRDGGFHRHAGTCEKRVGVATIETDAHGKAAYD